MSPNRYLIPDTPDSYDVIQLNTNNADEDVEQVNTPQVPTNTVGSTTERDTLLKRSQRSRRTPDRLATEQIESI